MRLKQLFGILLLATAGTALAADGAAQLSGVRVETRDNSGVVSIRANGPFTHTEYRPTDTLMLVDLAGVSVGREGTNLRAVAVAGVQSYRVLGYRSSSGAEVARVELNLTRGASVKVSDVEGGVEVRISALAANTAHPANAPAVKTSAPAAAVMAVTAQTSHISNISVTRSKDGTDVEVHGSGPMAGRTMKLSGPDRIVLDIPNSVLAGRTREIAVNSNDIKDVRAALYQSKPPATRIVVDLTTMHEFEVVPGANNLVLRLKNSANSSDQTRPAVTETPVLAERKTTDLPAAVTPAPASVTIAATASATPSVIPVAPVQAPAAMPEVHTTASVPAHAPEKSAARERAEQAASHLISPESRAPGAMPVTNASLAMPVAAVNAALQQQAQQASVPQGQQLTACNNGRYTGEPINLNVKDVDLKDFFRLLHDISGLNVVLDPSVKGTLTLVLDDVPWDQALAIVLGNNGLECQLQGNVLRIATLETLKTEAESRRAQQEAQALAVNKQTFTRYLSYAHAKDVVPIVKKFLSSRGDVVADDRSNAVIIDDIPDRQPKIDSLLTALDRKTPEVEIEARVVSTTRNFLRDIGTQIGFGIGGRNIATGGGTGVNGPTSALPGPGFIPQYITAAGDVTKIPLFSNLPATAPTGGLTLLNLTSNYRLDFILTMAENRGLAKVLSRPRVITQNNIKALIRQGARIPVVTLAQLGGPPTVQYFDAFLRLQVTPQITAENTIFLDVDVENTTPDFTRVSGSQVNPTLNTSQSTTQVLVMDGETVVIGGVIQTQNNIAIGQIPLLGDIPVLGHLFKHTTINTSTQELVFFITPKIIQT
ncbi:MAG TPA: type IV pilus secretin PilQ [Candidatus Saccharimonadales bacterium]|nr:type IV pilus secretin PilQ [Candidatus Saccharimonadales bacterium]